MGRVDQHQKHGYPFGGPSQFSQNDFFPLISPSPESQANEAGSGFMSPPLNILRLERPEVPAFNQSPRSADSSESVAEYDESELNSRWVQPDSEPSEASSRRGVTAQQRREGMKDADSNAQGSAQPAQMLDELHMEMSSGDNSHVQIQYSSRSEAGYLSPQDEVRLSSRKPNDTLPTHLDIEVISVDHGKSTLPAVVQSAPEPARQNNTAIDGKDGTRSPVGEVSAESDDTEGPGETREPAPSPSCEASHKLPASSEDGEQADSILSSLMHFANSHGYRLEQMMKCLGYKKVNQPATSNAKAGPSAAALKRAEDHRCDHCPKTFDQRCQLKYV